MTIQWVRVWTVALLAVVLVSQPAFGQEDTPLIVDIQIRGLIRLPENTIRAKIRSQRGASLDRATISNDIKRIFDLNAFSDVQVALKKVPGGVALLYILDELPVIHSINFSGNDHMPKGELEKVLDIQQMAIADQQALKANVQKLKDYYIDEGYFLTRVRYSLTKRDDNSVDVVFEIQEGAEIKIKTIRLIGNREIADDALKTIMQTKEGNYLSFMSKSGQFKPESLERDTHILKYFYGTKGHVEARISEPIVTMAHDMEHLTVTIHIHEGPVYHINKVDVIGQQTSDGRTEDLLYEKEFILSKLSMQPGDTFDRSMVERDSVRLADLLKDKGFADATASSISSTTDDHGINFTFVVQKGIKKRIGRIEMQGNDSTRDKVIRRVLEIHEGDIFSATKMKRSRAKITRLGFFERVELLDRPSEDPSIQDIIIRVKERQTGTFQIGAGFSSIENFMTTVQISKTNFMGHGQTFSFMASISSIRSYYAFRFHEPYFLDTHWSYSVNLYNSQELYEDFSAERLGGSMAFGYWFTDEFHLSLTYGLINSDVRIGGRRGRSDVEIATLLDDGVTSSLLATAFLDTRNDRMLPTGGQYTNASVEWAHPYLGSENEFTRIRAKTQWYFNMFWDVVLRLRATSGYIFSTTGEEIPLLERFYVGGIFDVRGFNRNSLGPHLAVPISSDPGADLTSYTIGGNKELVLNAEIEVPIFPAPINIRAVVFFDAGNAFGEGESLSLAELRTSVGFGFRWWSPVGPLRFEWGIPLKPEPGEEPIVFEFTIGNSF